MHQQVYTHKTVNCVEYMITDAMFLVWYGMVHALISLSFLFNCKELYPNTVPVTSPSPSRHYPPGRPRLALV